MSNAVRFSFECKAHIFGGSKNAPKIVLRLIVVFVRVFLNMFQNYALTDGRKESFTKKGKFFALIFILRFHMP